MSYGLHVKGRPPFDGVGMLVEVIRLEIGQSGTYLYPMLTAEQAARYRYGYSLVYTDTAYGRTSLIPGDGGAIAMCRVMPVAGGVAWETYSDSVIFGAGSVAAVLIWRWKKHV